MYVICVSLLSELGETMSISFKFRSSVNFDAVDIDGRSSISVGELMSKIIRHKNLKVCQDFDLVFYGAVSGQEYDDNNFQIPSGSSVIIKRVPAGAAPSVMTPIHAVPNFGMKGSYSPPNPAPSFEMKGSYHPPNPVNDEIDEFDDFGADFCPIPEAILPGSVLEFDTEYGSIEKANVISQSSGCPDLQPSNFSQNVPKVSGFNSNVDKGKIIGEPSAEQQMKLEKIFSANSDAFESTGLPSELKCPLCNTYFKEAVMMPCCQHSFCIKCIRLVLVEKVRCPKCSSERCKVEDLLPNLSLRQAIDHFLGSQLGFHDALHLYAPDGESGIQAKELSCAMTVVQKEPEIPHSPSATGKGSNQVMTDPFCNSVVRRNASFGASDYPTSNLAPGRDMSGPLVQKVKDIHGERGVHAHGASVQTGPGDLDGTASCQGENLPLSLPQAHLCDEADSTNKDKRGFWFETGGGERNFVATGRRNKVLRTCYMCGSPDHLIRDCPVAVASAPHSMLQTGPALLPGRIPGHALSYWNGAPFPSVRPFPYLYTNVGMMPFNASLVPVTLFGVPPHIPSAYAGLPPPGGIMRTGTMAPPVGNRAEDHLNHSDYSELQHESRRMLSNKILHREQNCDDEDGLHDRYRHNEPERLAENKIRKEREVSGRHSEDSFARRSQKNHFNKYVDSDTYSVDGRHKKSSHSLIAARDRKPYSLEISDSGKEHMPNSSKKHREDRYKNQNRISRKHRERRGQSNSDSSRGHQDQSDRDEICWRVESDGRGSHSKHNRYSESGLEPKSPSYQMRRGKDEESGGEPRHPRQSTKCKGEDLRDDRWQMVSGSDQDRRNDFARCRRKRDH